MKKVFGYIRVSSVDQEQGFGPAAQEDRIREYAAEHGLTPVEFFRESKSGESLAPRHELNIMLERAEAIVEEDGDAHIIFPGLDRLSRRLLDQESVVLRSQQTGVRIHSTLLSENDTLDPAYAGDPMRTAIRQFFGIINELDRAIIQRRLDSGLVKKAAQGGFTGGRVIFGYRSVNHELEIHPEHAQVIRRLFAIHAAVGNQSVVAAILAKTFPEHCRNWTNGKVSKLLRWRDLYEKGLFKPRGSVQTFTRPELIILGEPDQVVAGSVEVEWESLPDPVPLVALSLIWGESEAELKRIISLKGILLRHIKRKDFVPKSQAEKLAQYVKSGN